MQACQCLLTSHTCPLQAPGETAEARIAGKLRQLRKLVEKAVPGRAAEASAGAHTPPGHMAWFTLVGLPAMVLLPRVLSDDMAQKRSVHQECIRNIQQAVQRGLSQEAVARAGKKPLQVCCNSMLRAGGPTLGWIGPQTGGAGAAAAGGAVRGLERPLVARRTAHCPNLLRKWLHSLLAKSRSRPRRMQCRLHHLKRFIADGNSFLDHAACSAGCITWILFEDIHHLFRPPCWLTPRLLPSSCT